ncbi:MAG TPA: hypothetical protein VJ249_00140 [Candidatus Bathyarchaeia archaeon]|nr:hypothetical protein [Candidatus Bathyarchaeia archaeon]
MSERKAWLDVAMVKCPSCGRYYADASWYVVEIGSDIECGTCHETFNTKKHAVDRFILELTLNEREKADKAEIKKHF